MSILPLSSISLSCKPCSFALFDGTRKRTSGSGQCPARAGAGWAAGPSCCSLQPGPGQYTGDLCPQTRAVAVHIITHVYSDSDSLTAQLDIDRVIGDIYHSVFEKVY